MDIIERIEEQVSATGLPLFAVTLTAVPCSDTPLILTLHWHAFVQERLADLPQARSVAWRSVPSSALQLNERWSHLESVDRAALEAGWQLGAWDVARAERLACVRPGADGREALDCLRAFGAAVNLGPEGRPAVLADAPDAEELLGLGARRGYLLWMFRPVHGGIWGPYRDDDTLGANGRRPSPCPLATIPPASGGDRRTVYRLGRPALRDLH